MTSSNKLGAELKRKYASAMLGAFAVAAFAGSGVRAYAQDGPTVVRDSVQVRVSQQGIYRAKGAKDSDGTTTSWLPEVRFRVNGPIPGGSQLSVVFTRPDGSLWLQNNVDTSEIPAGEHITASTSLRSTSKSERKYITGVGVYGFKIRCKNELTNQNQVLFTGKYKVARIDKHFGDGSSKHRGEFWINHDWALPIGNLSYYNPYDTLLPPKLTFWTWIKGPAYGNDLAGYLFFNGKQVASTKEQGKGTTVDADVEMNTNSNDRTDPTWKQWHFVWGAIAANPDPEKESPYYVLASNPGEYTIKILRNGKLCREAKFSVGADGAIIDSGIAAANKMTDSGDIVGVKVLGTTDGLYDKLAWKTDAYYGNPLKGFTAP